MRYFPYWKREKSKQSRTELSSASGNVPYVTQLKNPYKPEGSSTGYFMREERLVPSFCASLSDMTLCNISSWFVDMFGLFQTCLNLLVSECSVRLFVMGCEKTFYEANKMHSWAMTYDESLHAHHYTSAIKMSQLACCLCSTICIKHSSLLWHDKTMEVKTGHGCFF